MMTSVTIRLFIPLMLLPGVLLSAEVFAASYRDSYLPPEIVYATDLGQRLPVPRRINVNRADVNELMTLPGVTENIALKLIRIRPVKDLRDFHRMPWLGPKQVERLIDRIQSRIEF